MSGDQLFGQEEEADLRQIDRHARHQQQPEQRQQVAAQPPERLVAMEGGRCRIDRQPGVAAELLPAVLDEVRDQPAAEHPERQQSQDQQGRRAEVLALGDVAFLAGLLPAVRRGVLGFFAVVLGHGVTLARRLAGGASYPLAGLRCYVNRREHDGKEK